MNDSVSTDKQFINRITDIILASLENENFGVNELARESGFNLKVLNRKLRKITGKSGNRFIRDTRLNKALELLREGIYTVTEVGCKVGFNSPVYFSKCFHEYFGYPPGKVKRADMTDSEFMRLTEMTNPEKTGVAGRKRIVYYRAGIVFIIFLTVVCGYFFSSGSGSSNWTEYLDSAEENIPIAVMPFQNHTKDTTWNIWQEGLQSRFISNLSNSQSIKVRPQEIINSLLKLKGPENYAQLSPSVMGWVSRKIDADLYVLGSITVANSVTSVGVQLISVRTKEVIRSFKMEGNFSEKDAFVISDSLSLRLLNFILISDIANKHHIPNVGNIERRSMLAGSAEEYKYCCYGNKALEKGDNELAISWYKKALAIDSNDFGPMIGLSSAYGNSGRLEESINWVLKYYKMKDKWPVDQQLHASWAYAFHFEPPEEGIKYLKQLQDLSGTHIMGYLLGYSYCKMKKYYDAIPEFENYLKMYKRFGKELLENNWAYPHLAEAYNKTGQYDKERKIIKEWEKYNPGDIAILHQKASLALSEGDTAKARKYIERYMLDSRKKDNASEADVKERVGRIYYDSGIMDIAEDYYRKALDLDPDNPKRLFRFASFLSETDRKADEVPELMDRAMKFAKNKVDYYNYLDEKGWGFYKQGRYKEAHEIIEKAWNEAPFKLYTLNFHLDQARKAVDLQKL